MSTIHNEGDNARLALKWLSWADYDYVAARLLLRRGLLVQGAALANTALEKYFKTLFVLLGKEIPHNHDITMLYQQIAKEIPRLDLNEEFVQMLFKAYKLRYPDELIPGFNIALSGVPMLVELDRSVFEIRKGFVFRTTEKIITTIFDTWKEKSVEDLVGGNCYFGSASREDLFNGTSMNYEIRVLNDGSFLEATYSSVNTPDNGKFIIEGLKLSGENKNP